MHLFSYTYSMFALVLFGISNLYDNLNSSTRPFCIIVICIVVVVLIQVTDPVQLVCSKGGDLTLLRAVASLDYTEESSNIPCMLDQRDTLRMAMSKPQVCSIPCNILRGLVHFF